MLFDEVVPLEEVVLLDGDEELLDVGSMVASSLEAALLSEASLVDFVTLPGVILVWLSLNAALLVEASLVDFVTLPEVTLSLLPFDDFDCLDGGEASSSVLTSVVSPVLAAFSFFPGPPFAS